MYILRPQVVSFVPSKEKFFYSERFMGWLMKERRGPAWKHGWTDRTISSAVSSPPPLPVALVFGIVVFLLYVSFSMNYDKQMEKTAVGMKLFMVLVPVLLVLFFSRPPPTASGSV